ncbi:MAG: hypothetical protein ABI873_10770, partial [Marmoricola sp.]
MRNSRTLLTVGVATFAMLLLVSCQSTSNKPAHPLAPADAATWQSPVNPISGIHKIKHVVVIMQENRS